MGWFSCNSKSPVIQPLPTNNRTNNSPVTTTGTLAPRANFGETAQAIRQIQNCPSYKIYRSDQLNLSTEQYSVINGSVNTSMLFFQQLDSICTRIEQRNRLIARGPKNAALAERAIPQSDIDDGINFCDDIMAPRCKMMFDEVSDRKIDKNSPLLHRSYEVFNKTCDLLKNREKIVLLTENMDARRFSKKETFDYAFAPRFYSCCLDIASGMVPTGDDAISCEKRRDFLIIMADKYAKKGIIENQFPKIKQDFEKIKSSSKLDKEFIAITENLIRASELGLKNIQSSERSAIFEKIAPPMRPKKYDLHSKECLNVLDYRSILNDKSDAEITAILDELKAIPVILG